MGVLFGVGVSMAALELAEIFSIVALLVFMVGAFRRVLDMNFTGRLIGSVLLPILIVAGAMQPNIRLPTFLVSILFLGLWPSRAEKAEEVP